MEGKLRLPVQWEPPHSHNPHTRRAVPQPFTCPRPGVGTVTTGTVSPTSSCGRHTAHGGAPGTSAHREGSPQTARVRPATGCGPPAVFRSPVGRRAGPAARTGHDHLPFVSGPQQVGAQDDGDVTGGHLVGVAGLRELREELDQVPEDERVAPTLRPGAGGASAQRSARFQEHSPALGGGNRSGVDLGDAAARGCAPESPSP